jgi:hypothetical protein
MRSASLQGSGCPVERHLGLQRKIEPPRRAEKATKSCALAGDNPDLSREAIEGCHNLCLHPSPDRTPGRPSLGYYWVKLFIDGCLSPQLAARLNATGHYDAVHPLYVGRRGEPDDPLTLYA